MSQSTEALNPDWSLSVPSAQFNEVFYLLSLIYTNYWSFDLSADAIFEPIEGALFLGVHHPCPIRH